VTKHIEISCHCGATRVEVARKPRRLTDCNCSMCRRYGALWGYYQPSEVRKKYLRRDVDVYSWGDGRLRFIRCKICGCVVHYERTRGSPPGRMGVNMRNADPAVIAKIRVRRLDGAKTWKFLD
jgi:hypothetical protein